MQSDVRATLTKMDCTRNGQTARATSVKRGLRRPVSPVLECSRRLAISPVRESLQYLTTALQHPVHMP